MPNTEKEMRANQFMTALAMSKKALDERDYDRARYWLDGAQLIVDAMDRESRAWPSSDMDLVEIRAAGF